MLSGVWSGEKKLNCHYNFKYCTQKLDSNLFT